MWFCSNKISTPRLRRTNTNPTLCVRRNLIHGQEPPTQYFRRRRHCRELLHGAYTRSGGPHYVLPTMSKTATRSAVESRQLRTPGYTAARLIERFSLVEYCIWDP